MKMERKYARLTKTPYQKSNVGHTSFENRGKTCKAQVISTTRGGTM